MHGWLERLHYGNADTSGEVTQYWLNGTLRISPEEQVDFLRQFYDRTLPFQNTFEQLVEDALTQQPGTVQNARGVHRLSTSWPRDAVLNSKTGATTTQMESVSWLVGALNVAKNRYVFASAVSRERGGVEQLAAARAAMAAFERRRILPP